MPVHNDDVAKVFEKTADLPEIRAENPFRVLKGIEVDILEDGGLDLPAEVLGPLDLVVGAVHSKFHPTRAQQTKRILKAMDHPHFSVLAHPTGRLFTLLAGVIRRTVIRQRPP